MAVEGTGPGQPHGGVAGRGAVATLGQRPGHQPLGTPDHFGGGAAAEGQQQDPRRVDTLEHQLCDPVGERGRLAGAGAGDDQQRPALPVAALAPSVGGGRALFGIEAVEPAVRAAADTMMAAVSAKICIKNQWSASDGLRGSGTGTALADALIRPAGPMREMRWRRARSC
jgi:hypothetical protein